MNVQVRKRKCGPHSGHSVWVNEAELKPALGGNELTCVTAWLSGQRAEVITGHSCRQQK